MMERPTARVIDISGNVRKPSHGGRRQPGLCLSWTVDPTTGKPVARWVVDGAELGQRVPLDSVA
jgi:hypothetical protein